MNNIPKLIFLQIAQMAMIDFFEGFVKQST